MRGDMYSRIASVNRAAAIAAVLIVAAPIEMLAKPFPEAQLRAGGSSGRDGNPAPSLPDLSAARRAIERACALLPNPAGYEIALIDPALAGDPAAIRRLDAFTVRDADGRLRPKIYLNLESELVRQASRGDDLYLAALAAVIIHEIEHLRGGSEEMARRAERRFFEDLVAHGRIDRVEGQRYLALLRGQAGDDR